MRITSEKVCATLPDRNKPERRSRESFQIRFKTNPEKARIALYNGLSYNPSKNFVAMKEKDLNLSLDE